MLKPPPKWGKRTDSGVTVVHPVEAQSGGYQPARTDATKPPVPTTARPKSPQSESTATQQVTANGSNSPPHPENEVPSLKPQAAKRKANSSDNSKIDISRPPKICTIPGNKKFLDFYSKLIKAYPKDYAMIHGCGGKDYAPNSTIGLTLYDYTAGKGDSSVTVKFALDVEEISFFRQAALDARLGYLQPKARHDTSSISAAQRKLAQLSQRAALPDGSIAISQREIADLQTDLAKIANSVNTNAEYEGFPYVREKNDCRKKNSDGYVPVAKLVINYSPVYNGRSNPYPWYVYIENFWAPAIDQENGTTSHDSSKAIKKRFASINVSHSDFSSAMTRIDSFVRQWESRSYETINAACTQAEIARQDWLSKNQKTPE